MTRKCRLSCVGLLIVFVYRDDGTGSNCYDSDWKPGVTVDGLIDAIVISKIFDLIVVQKENAVCTRVIDFFVGVDAGFISVGVEICVPWEKMDSFYIVGVDFVVVGIASFRRRYDGCIVFSIPTFYDRERGS